MIGILEPPHNATLVINNLCHNPHPLDDILRHVAIEVDGGPVASDTVVTDVIDGVLGGGPEGLATSGQELGTDGGGDDGGRHAVVFDRGAAALPDHGGEIRAVVVALVFTLLNGVIFYKGPFTHTYENAAIEASSKIHRKFRA